MRYPPLSKANVTFLLDGSSSMQGFRWAEAIKSINAYVEGLRPEDIVTVTMFKEGRTYRGFNVPEYAHGAEPIETNAVLIPIRDKVTVGHWAPIGVLEATPHGNTPLEDASYEVLHQVLQTTDTDKNVVIIVTDGGENASRRWKRDDVTSLIKLFESREWEAIYIGADYDGVMAAATSYGAEYGKMMSVDSGSMEATMRGMSASTVAYASMGTRMNFTDNDRKKAKGL